jgi:cob(I)alamin adenosyltransferase
VETPGGYLHLYTGDGKGKTTCAVGVAVRAAGAGNRVAFVQFEKGHAPGREHYSERAVLRSLPGVEVHPFGCERVMADGRFRFTNDEADFEQARAALEKAGQLLAGQKYFLVICDEAITCVQTGLLEEEHVMGLVKQFRAAKGCELVLTGRGAWPALIEAADLVTEMLPVKHYFQAGIIARKGIDF